jgi:hypothetical protein
MKTLLVFMIAIVTSAMAFSQTSSNQDVEMSRKIRRILRVESRFAELPVSISVLEDEIYPLISLKKQELAPNYPEHSSLSSDSLLYVVKEWINQYPSEYETYVLFLEKTYRSYR